MSEEYNCLRMENYPSFFIEQGYYDKTVFYYEFFEEPHQ
jgi:hypothetical protein